MKKDACKFPMKTFNSLSVRKVKRTLMENGSIY